MRGAKAVALTALTFALCAATTSLAGPPDGGGKNPAPSAEAAPSPNDAPLPPVPAAVPEVPPAAGVPDDPELRRLVDGVKVYYDKVEHLRADFRQVVKQRTLSRTRKASGTFEFQKPGRMRWVYERPDRVLYVSDGDTLWTYQPEDALVYQAQITGSRLYNALRFLFGMGDLEKVFDIAMGPAHSPATAFLLLTPKGGEQDYKDLSLVVDRETFEIRESFLTDPLGNVTHYIFDKIDYETPIPETDFQFTPPAGVTVQKL